MTLSPFVTYSRQEPFGAFTVEFVACDPYLDPGWYWVAFGNEQHPHGPFETYGKAEQDARLEQ